MRRMLLMALLLAAAGCDLSGLDLSGIDDWNMGDGGGGSGGGGGPCCESTGIIRPIATPDVVLSPGSAFQLQALDPQGNLALTDSGTYSSSDTTTVTVTPTGWATAVSPGSALVEFRRGGVQVAKTWFSVVVAPPANLLRIEAHGLTQECGGPLPCRPTGSPIIDGWIGHAIDTRGLSLTFVGADGLQPTDDVAASPVPFVVCRAVDYCVTLTEPSPAHAWSAGENTLCFGVTVGDSVPEQAFEDTNNREWVVTWSRPGLFILRQSFVAYVRPSLVAPASAC